MELRLQASLDYVITRLDNIWLTLTEGKTANIGPPRNRRGGQGVVASLGVSTVKRVFDQQFLASLLDTGQRWGRNTTVAAASYISHLNAF